MSVVPGWLCARGRASRLHRRAASRQQLGAEQLEPRQLLASHPGIVFDATGEEVPVDPAIQAALGDLLAYISAAAESQPTAGAFSLPAATPHRELIVWGNGGAIDGVLVTAVAHDGQAGSLATDLAAVGGTAIVTAGDYVSAVVPFTAIDDVAAIAALDYGDVAFESVANGSPITNQAAIALGAEAARARFGSDGSGVRVGVISDSFNNLGGYAYDVSIGVLPPDVAVLKDYPLFTQDGVPQPGDDEGRAMAQLVHSIAPGASLAFASSGSTPASFAESIRMLAEAGCQIIVDDITEGGVPWFQDGLVAQAVDDVVRDFGVAYFTSAGNFGRNSYAADFRPVAAADLEGLPAELADVTGLSLHDFDPGPGIDVFQTVGIPAGLDSVRIVMQWDQPWEDNASDIDLYVFSADGIELLTRLEGSHQLGADPVLGGTLPIPPGLDAVQLVVAHAGGVAPGYFKYLTYHATVEPEYVSGDSTITGHANAASAAAVGASFYFRTPAYRQTPGELAPSSSRGGTPILFAEDGQRLAKPVVRQQPRFVAPNIGDTSFFGSDVELNRLPNFSGTSAAAPNAAAVAALMKQLDPTLSPEEVFSVLGTTASGMPEAGGPRAVGAGLINAERALARVAGVTVTGTVFEDFDRDGSLSLGERPLAGETVFLDLNGNGQLDRAPVEGATRAYVGFQSTESTEIGIRTLIENPNTPNTGPLQQPFTATAGIDVSELPGAVTDLGVVFTLQSDQVLANQMIGPLFVTLISPNGVRVPIDGTTVLGEGTSASSFDPYPLLLPADRQPYPRLASQFETPVSEFLNGSGNAVLSQVDLAAVVGSSPNGRWQLEVQSGDADPARTATLESWELFLQTAEPSVQTGADGGYRFTGLSPAPVAGPIQPQLVVPPGRSLITPQGAYELTPGVGQQLAGVNFAVSLPTPIPRPPLRRSATIRVDRAVMGPQPVQFSWADLSLAVLGQPTGERFVVATTTIGRVEKWNGQRWIDVSRPPMGSSPRELLQRLAERVISPTDALRWLPPAGVADGQTAFLIIGWDGVAVGTGLSEVGFEPTPA